MVTRRLHLHCAPARNESDQGSVGPGEHVLSPAGNVENVELVKFKAEEGKNYFFRIDFGMGWVKGRLHIRQVSEEEGRKAVIGKQCTEAIN